MYIVFPTTQYWLVEVVVAPSFALVVVNEFAVVV
jgi:hypothetical protein